MKNLILKKIKFIKNNLKFISIIFVFIFFINIPISYAQDAQDNRIGAIIDGITLPFTGPAKLTGALLNSVGLSPESLALGGLNSILGFFKDFVLFILGQTIIPLLNGVMSYQNFFTNGVNIGWDITRNFTNLFFALILLLIAIATVLDLSVFSNYNAKNLLPKFIFVALFINFSKAIVGFLIDISQIVMISFYNSFGSSMADIISNASKLAESGAESTVVDNISINVFTIIIVAILAFVLLWTALILAMRIVTLWFVIMLSPLAFMSALIPGLKGINSDWTKKLQESLITGPTLMFLLYLAFAIMSNGISIDNVTTGNLMTNGNLLSYVLVIGLLFLANITASQAAQSAPPILKNAVGVAGSIATLGIAAKAGVPGATGLRQGLKDAWSGTGGKVVGLGKDAIAAGDKAIGGITRGTQVLTGGAINVNDRYESWKSGNKTRLQDGDSFGGGYFGRVAQQTLGGDEGRKNAYKRSRAQFAESARLRTTNERNENGEAISELNNNPELRRDLAEYEGEIMSRYKDELDETNIITDLQEAISDNDRITARVLTLKLAELGKIGELFRSGGVFEQYGQQYATEAEQLTAFLQNELQDTPNRASQYDNSYRARLENTLKTKSEQAPFASGIRNRQNIPRANVINDPVTSPLFNSLRRRSISEVAKDLPSNLFSVRVQNPNGSFAFTPRTQNLDESWSGGSSLYEFNVAAFDAFITGTPIETLRDRRTWSGLNRDLVGRITAGLGNSNTPEHQAVLQGLGVSTTPNNPPISPILGPTGRPINNPTPNNSPIILGPTGRPANNP